MRKPSKKQHTTQHTEPTPKCEISKISNVFTPSLKQCCPKDTDYDGNCPIHSAPGVLRNLDMNKTFNVIFGDGDIRTAGKVKAEDFQAASLMAMNSLEENWRIVKIEEIS